MAPQVGRSRREEGSMRVRSVVMLGALLAAVGCGSAPAPTPSESTNTDQLVKYYRKKNNLPASAKLAVTGVHDSSIKGAREGTLEIGEGPGAQKVTFLTSPDGQFVAFGTVEDVTVDPSKAVMAKIDLKDQPAKGLADTGIDMTKWADCFDNQKTAGAVDAQMQEGSSVGVRGTPGFIINGRLVSGAQPFESFKNIIDDELASAK